VTRDTTLENLAPLARWCEANINGFRGPISACKFAIGQSNPTYLLNTGSGRYVLRRKPPGALLKSAHAVDREYHAMRGLADTDIPVPEVYALCEDDAIIGSMFFVMEFLDGRTFLDPALPELSNDQRRALYTAQVEVLAKLAAVDVDAVGLAGFGKPGNYLTRQVDRWTRQYRATETESIPAMEALIGWLPEHIPADDGRVALVHGDFRLDNLIIHPDEPSIIGVIDWELSTLGHPFVDFSYWATMLRLPRKTYHRGLTGMDRGLLNIPEEQELIATFCRLSNMLEPPDLRFWIAFHGFRFAAILQGVLKRHLDGNASSPEALEVGRMVRPVAELARTAMVSDL